MREHHDASGRLTIALDDDDRKFSTYVPRLEQLTGVALLRRLDTPDQRYWEYRVNGTTVVIHADVFAGVSVHIEDGTRDDLLRSIAAAITEPERCRE
jgi:hypothetical protein